MKHLRRVSQQRVIVADVFVFECPELPQAFSRFQVFVDIACDLFKIEF